MVSNNETSIIHDSQKSEEDYSLDILDENLINSDCSENSLYCKEVTITDNSKPYEGKLIILNPQKEAEKFNLNSMNFNLSNISIS